MRQSGLFIFIPSEVSATNISSGCDYFYVTSFPLAFRGARRRLGS